MDDREGGFIVLHRRIRSWALWKFLSAEQRMVWIQILLDANWKDSEVWLGTERVEVKRGQLIHSENTLARRAGVSRKVVRTTLAKLIAEGAITRTKAVHTGSRTDEARNDSGRLPGQPAGPTPSIITVVNYCKYQDVSDEAGQAQGQAGAQGGPKAGQAGALSEPEEPREPLKLSAPSAEKRARKKPTGPNAEVYAYWCGTIWPRYSDLPYSEGKEDFIQLARRVKAWGAAEVIAAIDRAAEDPRSWWERDNKAPTLAQVCAALTNYAPARADVRSELS